MLVIEHNLDVIKTADWLIDLGPEGGNKGGLVVAEGTPEHVASVPASYTGAFLAPILDGRAVSVGKTKRKATAASDHHDGQGRVEEVGRQEVAGEELRSQEVDRQKIDGERRRTAKKAAAKKATPRTTAKKAAARR